MWNFNPRSNQKPKFWSSKLKSKSPAEVADIFNVSKRQGERIHKCYQETGYIHDRPRRPCKTTAQDDSLLVWLSNARPKSTAVLPTPRPTAWRKVGQQKSGKKIIFQMKHQLHPKRRQYCRWPSGARLDPRWKDSGLGLHPIRRCQGDL